MNLPIFLTLLRMGLGPLFLVLYMYGVGPIWLLTLWGFAELTDLFDGTLARSMQSVTEMGKLLDPLADSLFRVSIFLTLTLPPVSLPLLLGLVFLYRDGIVGGLRTLCALRGFALSARMSGKLKAIIQAAATFLVLALVVFHSEGWIELATLQVASFWIVFTAATYTVLSGCEYLYAHRDDLRRALSEVRAKK